MRRKFAFGYNSEPSLRLGIHREPSFWAIGIWPFIFGVETTASLRRRKRKRTEAQANLEKLHQEYLEGQLIWGTDLRRDSVAESYSKFPPDL